MTHFQSATTYSLCARRTPPRLYSRRMWTMIPDTEQDLACEENASVPMRLLQCYFNTTHNCSERTPSTPSVIMASYAVAASIVSGGEAKQKEQAREVRRQGPLNEVVAEAEGITGDSGEVVWRSAVGVGKSLHEASHMAKGRCFASQTLERRLLVPPRSNVATIHALASGFRPVSRQWRRYRAETFLLLGWIHPTSFPLVLEMLAAPVDPSGDRCSDRSTVVLGPPSTVVLGPANQ
ncbi:hypothetical protein C8R47DRAFT_1244879 [Mycena vitilis]|nr:hypothetical protein C8R47DRAFT_1244879 [Mycena vitilis]